jgi:hypothetical protein
MTGKACKPHQKIMRCSASACLASVESYGVDVYKTTKDTNLKYINGPNTVTFFGLVLFKEA